MAWCLSTMSTVRVVSCYQKKHRPEYAAVSEGRNASCSGAEGGGGLGVYLLQCVGATLRVMKRDRGFEPRDAVGSVHHQKGGHVHFAIDYDPEWGLLDSFADALRKHARCADCGAPPPVDFSSCTCGGDAASCRWYRVENAIWRSELDHLWKRERRRVHDWNSRRSRKEAVRNSFDPPYTSEDIALLRSTQGNACYYCGGSISGSFQVDHLEPLSRGGSDGVGNIMLSCAACNRSKWALSEAQFWRRRRQIWPQSEFSQVREAAKAMKRERNGWWLRERERER